jgi:glucosylceramidase
MNFNIRCGLIVFCAALFLIPARGQSIQWISTDRGHPWLENPAPVITANASLPPDAIEVHPDKPDQVIDGFGGCFNERGWDALSCLSAEQRDGVIKALFSPTDGSRYTICRMPIGASDYAMDAYSLDDTPEDYELHNFSLQRDQKYLIPYIRAAMTYDPDLKIWGVPWSPPAWMKVNDHYSGAKIRWEPRVLDAYAHYFARYVTEYQKLGIHVYAVHLQNEPAYAPVYPGCNWTGDKMRDFLKTYLIPVFQQEKINAEIWLGTINSGDYPSYTGVVMADPFVRQNITGIGYQWAGKAAIATAHQQLPDKKLMQTEAECGDGTNRYERGLYTFSLIKHYLAAGASSFMYWNMVLDSTGMSSWGWRQNSLISIDRKNHAVTYNNEFYVMKQCSRAIDPGARRVGLTGADDPKALDGVAFLNLDGRTVVLLANNTTTTKTVTIASKQKSFLATLQPESINSFTVPF